MRRSSSPKIRRVSRSAAWAAVFPMLIASGAWAGDVGVSEIRGMTVADLVALPEMTIDQLFRTVESGGTPLVATKTPPVMAAPEGLATLDGLVATSVAAAPSEQPAALRKPDVTTAEPTRPAAPAATMGLIDAAAPVKPAYGLDKSRVNYVTVNLQLVDERSDWGDVSDASSSKLFPLSAAQVKLVGTDTVAVADSRGVVRIADLPASSRYLVSIEDPYGRVRPAVAEIVTPAASSDATMTRRVRMLRQLAFDTYGDVLRMPQESLAASVCGHAVAVDGKTPVSGITVSIDSKASSPMYFNDLGLLEPTRRETSSNGRFCFFNVEAGPAAITFARGGDVVKTTMVPLFAGRHSDEIMNVELAESALVDVASVPPANLQLNSESGSTLDYRAEKAIPVYPFGSREALPVEDGNFLRIDERAGSFHEGRMFLYAQGTEFEDAVYAIDRQGTADTEAAKSTIGLLPQGFVADMALFAQTTQQDGMGVVVAEHGPLAGQGDKVLNVRLMDEAGRDVGEGWYFADQPMNRAVFFNVPPGAYMLLVETQDHYWIASQTAVVYADTVSVVSTGSPVSRR